MAGRDSAIKRLADRFRQDEEQRKVSLRKYLVSVIENPCGKGRRRFGLSVCLLGLFACLLAYILIPKINEHHVNMIGYVALIIVCVYLALELCGCVCVIQAKIEQEDEDLELGRIRKELRKDWEKGGEKQNRGGEKFALFIQATKDGNLESVSKCLREGQDPNGRENKTGRMAIHWACERGYTKIVRRLIEAGARIDKPEYEHNLTPLHIACFYGFVPIVDILIDNKAPLEARNKKGLTPLELTDFAALDESTRQVTHEQISLILRHALGEKGADLRRPKGAVAMLLDHDVPIHKPKNEGDEDEEKEKAAGDKDFKSAVAVMKKLNKKERKNFRG